jgi:UrcA family protein
MEPNMIRIVPASAAFAALWLAAASSAHAQDYQVRDGFAPGSRAPAGQTDVSYADLDLSTSQGAQALAARIRQAADAVCRTERSDTDAWERRQYEACRQEAVAAAVRQVGSDRVRSLLAAQEVASTR